jgi:hypothetical protein
MNIHIVAANLRNTIEGKERHLEGLRQCIRDLDALDCQDDSWFRATVTVEFLQINVDELKKILADVEECCRQATEASWIINPERMGQ